MEESVEENEWEEGGGLSGIFHFWGFRYLGILVICAVDEETTWVLSYLSLRD